MRARRIALVLVAAVGLAAALAEAQTPPTVAGDRPNCIAVSFTARYSGYGYNHLVTVRSSCATTASCTVSTDVTPAPTRLSVAPGESQTVTTFVGSPARVFVPTVSCTTAH